MIWFMTSFAESLFTYGFFSCMSVANMADTKVHEVCLCKEEIYMMFFKRYVASIYIFLRVSFTQGLLSA